MLWDIFFYFFQLQLSLNSAERDNFSQVLVLYDIAQGH